VAVADQVAHACRCRGTGIATLVIPVADAVILSALPCPAGCAIPGSGGTVENGEMAASLNDEGRRPAAAGGGFVTCAPCQDFRTDVTDGVEHPCQHCQPEKYQAWLAANAKTAP
jgi:hypothetical protein